MGSSVIPYSHRPSRVAQGTLIAMWCMKHFGWRASHMIGYLRVCRPVRRPLAVTRLARVLATADRASLHARRTVGISMGSAHH